jgi:exodeoxyribonuclease VII small subunit
MTGENGRVNRAARWHATLQSESFEEILDCLEQVVSTLEAGQLSLADSLDHYEIGIQLTKRCEAILAEAELRVSQLTLDDMESMSAAEDAGISEEGDGPDGPAF